MSQNFLNTLAEADKTYGQLSDKAMLEFARIVRYMLEYGPERLKMKGTGTEIHDMREFQTETDDPRAINPWQSAKGDHFVANEYRAENRQPVFTWRKSTELMDIQYSPDRFTKKEYAEIVSLATMMGAAKNENKIGLLDSNGLYRSKSGVNNIAAQLRQVNVMTGDSFIPRQKIPRNSKVIIISDFLAADEKEEEQLLQDIKRLKSLGVQCKMCMVLDPAELDLPYDGHVLMDDGKGGRTEKQDIKSLRAEYRPKMIKYIKDIEKLITAHGFEFVFQTTKEPPIELVSKIFKLKHSEIPFSRPSYTP